MSVLQADPESICLPNYLVMMNIFRPNHQHIFLLKVQRLLTLFGPLTKFALKFWDRINLEEIDFSI
jgi:hypothetical protein